MESGRELIERLNTSDETSKIEAKRGSAIDRSIMETICAFSNEPGLEGGSIILGVERKEHTLFPSYEVTGVNNPDKLQSDLASQCAGSFNQAIRPEIEVESINGLNILKIYVPELPASQKPVYFKHEGLPKGAYRRIGPTDQRCTEDDLLLFFNHNETFDSALVTDTSWEDIDENAIETYRSLRAKVNPYAEELNFTDQELLISLGCMKKVAGKPHLTYAGLLVFGSRMAQRRLMPAVRLDYIRVPGNEWVSDPENRFTTIDMRGPLPVLLQRAYNAIADDLPKGFLLPEGQLQAESIGLPGRVLREALVNALMHRSYRANQPTQIIRYGNRIEIINPGFSLKPEDHLGEPGSEQRNPFIAAIFHETNLAETKGSGIRTMRKLMEQAGMAPPTYESSHSNNQFTARLLLHHFLSEEDLKWLDLFKQFDLSENQKKALVFAREVGAIDNATYRQLSGFDGNKASNELRALRDNELLELKGKGRATYYIPGTLLSTKASNNSQNIEHGSPNVLPSTLPSMLLPTFPTGVTNLPASDNEPVKDTNEPPTQDNEPALGELTNQLPNDLQEIIHKMGKRKFSKGDTADVIVQLCTWKPLKLREIAEILGRTSEKHLLHRYITPLRKEGRLQYTEPDMPNHPDQAYKAS
ncbi:putative DNA binding domain-containing protein [Pontibacter sp. HSC-14F20]|uniref:ATP-binding protein n=1 Tax=Pontibacter sp. HSC-14F20 TaxID=2864136 RepID=UPI001C735476|nr:ATP-binding protein [Pontibacter sp. HSC-14F20]MBX0334842.1 putative DNA binding domain-containing protein [Pontibacter sp. HSC-14F20]